MPGFEGTMLSIGLVRRMTLICLYNETFAIKIAMRP